MEVPECNVCNVPLDEEEHQPRHLGCSHDACTTCVKLLIRNGFIECPMCRIVVQANTFEDFPINHGVVQVLRLFKTFKMSENKPKEESETTNGKVICRIHEQSVNKGCFSCKVWICSQCIEFHTSDIGCEIQEYTNYLMNSKKDHKNKVNPTLLSVRKNLKSLSSEFSDLEIKKKNIEEQMEKVKKCIEEGSNTLSKFVAATDKVKNASTSMELDKNLHTSNEWYKLIQIWCKNTDTSPNLLEKIISNKEMYASMDINGKSNSCKLTFGDGNLYQHCFRAYGSVINSSKVLPYEHVQNWLPSTCDLVFLDLAIAGELKGRVTICLRKDLDNYAKYIPLIFSGEDGLSLLDEKCYSRNFYDLAMKVSATNVLLNKFKRDASAGCMVVQGSVLANWHQNVFKSMLILHADGIRPYNNTSTEVFGSVVSGLDVVKLCRSHKDQTEVTVTDCGIVFKEDALKS